MVSILQLFYCFWLFRTSLLLLIKACGMHVVAWLTPRHWWARCGSDTVGSELGHLTQQSFISVCLLHSPSETGKNLPAVLECWTRSLAWEDPLEEGMATHCSIPAWRISWTEEPGALQSMGSQRVRHDWATNTSSIGENGNWKEKGEKKDFLHYTTLLERPTVGPTNQKE